MIGPDYLGPGQSNKCPECLTFMFRDETYCPTCKTELNRVFKAEHTASFKVEQWFDDLSVTYEYLHDDDEDIQAMYAWFQNDVIADEYSFGEMPRYSDNVCCNKTGKECSCKTSYSFGEAYLFYEDQFLCEKPGMKPEDVAYITDSGDDIPLCRSCVHYSTFSCKKFRNWLRLHWENPDLSEDFIKDHSLIEPCVEYDSAPGTPVDEETFVINYIRLNSGKNEKQDESYNRFLDTLENDDYDYDTQYYFESLT